MLLQFIAEKDKYKVQMLTLYIYELRHLCEIQNETSR